MLKSLAMRNMKGGQMHTPKSIHNFLYHIGVILLSAAVALSLPAALRAAAQKALQYWSFIENEQIFMVSLELGVAAFLIISLTLIGRSWRNMKLAGMARDAGLAGLSMGGYQKKSRLIKERQGSAKELMLMGSTGYLTFAAPEGDLHQAIQRSREAKILLLDPSSEGAKKRAVSLADSSIAPSGFRKQIEESIVFLKKLRASKRQVRLKLYQDVPLFKIGIVGDYIYMRHYHAGRDVREMPEYVFRNSQEPGNLYLPFYQYFLSRWRDPLLPEYDFDTDELVYRDTTGAELRREGFHNRTDSVSQNSLSLTAVQT
jgi:hypothetical protein